MIPEEQRKKLEEIREREHRGVNVAALKWEYDAAWMKGAQAAWEMREGEIAELKTQLENNRSGWIRQCDSHERTMVLLAEGWTNKVAEAAKAETARCAMIAFNAKRKLIAGSAEWEVANNIDRAILNPGPSTEGGSEQ